MFLAFFGALLATVSDGEACDAVAACRDEESLLQAMSKGEVQTDGNPTDLLSGTFCPDFFEAEDVQYASVGVQQVEKIFMKYCEDLGIAHEYCDQNAEAVFRPGGAGVQELTNDMCTDLLALRMKVMSESPTALLARQSSSGRDDESSVDDAFWFKGPPRRRRYVAPAPTPRPPPVPCDNRYITDNPMCPDSRMYNTNERACCYWT